MEYRYGADEWASAIINNGNNGTYYLRGGEHRTPYVGQMESLALAFQGIARPRIETLLAAKTNQLITSLKHDERFMAELLDADVEYYATSEDHREAWEEFVRDAIHTTGCCPHENAETHAATYQKSVNDKSKRLAWAHECARVDGSNRNIEFLQQYEARESVAFFLKDHPVVAVYCNERREWIGLDKVCGFCPVCSTPVTETGPFTVPAGLERHAFCMDCTECAESFGTRHRRLTDWTDRAHYRSHGSGGYRPRDLPVPSCYFDKGGQARKGFLCVSCEFIGALDGMDGDFAKLYKRPFDWPPGADFPVYADFAGNPANGCAAWEEE